MAQNSWSPLGYFHLDMMYMYVLVYAILACKEEDLVSIQQEFLCILSDSTQECDSAMLNMTHAARGGSLLPADKRASEKQQLTLQSCFSSLDYLQKWSYMTLEKTTPKNNKQIKQPQPNKDYIKVQGETNTHRNRLCVTSKTKNINNDHTRG